MASLGSMVSIVGVKPVTISRLIPDPVVVGLMGSLGALVGVKLILVDLHWGILPGG